MSERTCELDGKIFEGVQWHRTLCQGCAGDGNPDVCIRLAACLPGNIIWIQKEPQ